MFRFHDSHSPLLVFQMNGDLTADDIHEIFDIVEERAETVLAQHPFIATLSDLTGLENAPSTSRKIAAERLDAFLTKVPAGKALYQYGMIESSWTRGLITALHWLSRRQFHFEIYRDLRAATPPIEALFREHGLEPPSAIRLPQDLDKPVRAG